MAKFSEVLTIRNGKNQKKVENPSGQYPIYGSGGIMGYADDYICEANSVIIGRKGNINNPIFVETPFWNVDTAFGLCVNPFKLWPKYLYYFCENYDFEQLNTTVTIPSLTKTNLLNIEIPLPPLDEQRKIAAVLDKVSDLIAKRRQQLDKLDTLVKARFVEMFGDPKDNPMGYSKKQIKDTCRIITGNTPSRIVSDYYGNDIEWVKTDNIVEGLLYPTVAAESLSQKGMAVGRTVEKDSILMACIAGSLSSIGRVCITDRKVAFNQQINAIEPKEYNTMFLYVMLQLSKGYLIEEINMALKGILSKSKLEGKVFIVPPMDLQQQFASFVSQVNKSKLSIQKSCEKLETLKKALMQQYFG